MIRRLVAAAAVVALAALPAMAIEDPSTARGFSPEKVYQFGDLDSVNLFNGNLVLRIGIGQRSVVSAQLGYGLTLAYNSKVWDTVTTAAPFEYCGSAEGMTGMPRFTSNAGMGWSLGFGRLFPVSDASGTGQFLFESTDGAAHVFERQMVSHQQGNPSSPTISLTADNSHLRLTLTGWTAAQPFDKPSAATVELPDGTRLFYVAHHSGGTFGEWLLTAIKDRFENTISAAWDTAELRQTITDPFGRQTIIQYQTVHALTPVYKKVVSSVTVPAFRDPATGQASATYLFSYTWARLLDPIQLNQCDPQYVDDVPLLTAVTLPDGTTFQMNHPVHQNPSFGTVREAELRTLTLPTRGQLAYDYGAYNLPGPTCSAPAPAQGGVSVRSYVDPFGNTQQWTYTQALGDYSYSTNQCQYDQNTPSLEEPRDLSTTTVTTPSGAKELHYFSVFQGGGIFTANPAVSPHGFRVEEYGLSLTHLAPGYGNELLSEEIFDCSTGICASTPVRSTYVEYDDHVPNDIGIADILPKATRTLFHDDLVNGSPRYTEVVGDDYDGYGHYRRSTTGGNFASRNVRTTYTNYNPGTDESGTINGTDPFAGRHWILGMYSEQWVNEQSHTAKAESFFDADTGFLLRTRTLLGDAATAANVPRNAHDLLTTFEHTAGNVTKERSFGGDTCGSLSFVNACGATVTCPTLDPIDASSVLPSNPVAGYEVAHGYTFGSRSLTQFLQCNGQPMPFDAYHATIDRSGLPSQTLDTGGLPTNYVFDAMGRLTRLEPPGESALQVAYTPASAFGSTPARVTATRGTTETQYQYDGLGRLWKQMRRMPGNQWALRETTFDSAGRVGNDSGFEQTTTGFAFSPLFRTTYSYDVFGRPKTVTVADGHATSFAYRGISETTQTVNVATGTTETPVTTRQTFDGQSSLAAVTEAADTVDAVTTSYAYDVGGRLTTVTMGAEQQQQRFFTYDNRGFLLSERHPELGVAGNGIVSYGDYDARGHSRRRTVLGKSDIRTFYDAAERVTRIFDLSAQRDLKLFQYDAGGQCAVTCSGRLSQAARFHYDPDLGTVIVTESWQYSGVNGRPERHDRTVGTTAFFTGASFFNSESYDSLGNVAAIGYPCRGSQTPCEDTAHAPRTVGYSYTNGWLTGVGGWGTLTYQPNGLLATIRHNSSPAVTDTWTPDPWQLTRAARITSSLAGGGALWTSGDYAYDGAGNIKAVGATQYAYDAFNRLAQWTTASPGSTQTASVTYDTFGNQLATQYAFCGTSNDGSRRCGGTTFQPLAISGTTNHYAGHAYDAAGNMLSDGGHAFTYDPLNVTTRTESGGRDFRFFYTADDERIAAVQMIPGGTRTTYTVRGFRNELLSEWTDGQWQEDDIFRGAQLLATETPAGTNYQHLDHLGSPRLKTNALGAIVGQQDFAPFGAGGTSNGGTLQFTGHERDAANLAGGTTDLPDYMHARYYSAGVGRFLSVDPSRDANPRQPQSWNRYSYVRNNPINMIDPDGRDVFEDVWNWAASLFVRQRPENDRARQAQQLADDPATGVTQSEAKSQKASTYRDGTKTAVVTIGAAVTQMVVTAILFKGIGKALDFATPQQLTSHFVKHGQEFGYATEAEYVAGARSLVDEAVASRSGFLFKNRGTDTLIYKSATNEFVVVTKDSIFRTYFKPVDGLNYFMKQ